jgi:hypothetical protein
MRNKAENAPIGTATSSEVAVESERSLFVGEYLSHIARAPESKTQKTNQMDRK